METPPDIGRVVVVIPTYNERNNLEQVICRVRDAVPPADVLVVDDASPDGTGRLADRIAGRDRHVHVLHRGDKAGLGAAYLAGFRWVLDRGYDVVVEMDADGSHQPEQLPRMLGALPGADLVLGSRWTRGGTIRDWSRTRELISRGGNGYARLLLGLPVRDATTGFRALRATALQKLDLDDVRSQGYCFQVDLVLRAVRAGLRVVEVPITFVERTQGASKMSRAVLAEALWRVSVWGIDHRLGAGRRRGREGR